MEGESFLALDLVCSRAVIRSFCGLVGHGASLGLVGNAYASIACVHLGHSDSRRGISAEGLVSSSNGLNRGKALLPRNQRLEQDSDKTATSNSSWFRCSFATEKHWILLLAGCQG